MKKKNEESSVLALYKLAMAEDEQEPQVFLEAIEEVAKEDPEEFDTLVNLFNSLNEDDTAEFEGKLVLSDILLKFGYEPLRDFFVRVLFSPKSEGDDKFWVAMSLVAMNDYRGISFLEEVVSNIEGYDHRSVVSGLYSASELWRSSVMGLRLLLRLADQHKKVAELIDRQAVEKCLAKLIEPNLLKRVWKRFFGRGLCL